MNPFLYFPDDYNQLCPHGSGLLPLPVSSTHYVGGQDPYRGTFFQEYFYFTDIQELL